MSTTRAGTVATIGATHELEGFALVGASVHPAATAEEALAAWRDLDEGVALVILSRDAATTLAPALAERPQTLTVTMP